MRQVVAIVCVLGFLLTGCGGGELTEEDRAAAAAYGSHAQGSGGHHSAATTSSAAPLPTRFYTWQELAATVGCEAKLQGKAADFRQAACVIGDDTYVFLDFDTAEGQAAWLEYALLYGGVYLVGERWVLSGKSREYMETLLPRLGGSIQEDASHGG